MTEIVEVGKPELLERLSDLAGVLAGCRGDYCYCHSEQWDQLDETLFLLGYEEMDR